MTAPGHCYEAASSRDPTTANPGGAGPRSCGAPGTGRASKQFVAARADRLELVFLPPYSPELHPDEWVWKNVKHDNAGRLVARTVGELRNGVTKAVARLQSSQTSSSASSRTPTWPTFTVDYH